MKKRIVSLRIDVTKISKEKLFVGKKGTYLEVCILVSDEPSKFDTPCSIWERETKEERDAKKDRTYLGNGKIIWQEGEAIENKTEPTEVKSLPSDLPF